MTLLASCCGAPIAAHPADAPVWPREIAHLKAHGHFDAGTATSSLLEQDCTLCPRPARSSGMVGSIRTRLLSLDPTTTVHPGHGSSTTTAAERPHLDEWITRGW